MKLEINGDPRECGEVRDVRDVVRTLSLPEQAVLVEHNGEALRREEWVGRGVSEGDRLEIIRIVAGG